MVNQRVDRSQRLAWIDGICILSVVMLLLYHAQLRFTGYAYTPQPTGLADNLQQILAATYRLPEVGLFMQWLGVASWFGYQFVDVLVLVSGFGLALWLNNKPLLIGRFLSHWLGQVLWPFWTIAWLAYPILWAIAVATKTYFPPPWYVFAGVSFPLVYDYNSELLMSSNANWVLMSLILSFVAAFPFLWRLRQRWGPMNLWIVSLLLTIAYRTLAIYVLRGHPTYVLWDSQASSQPFALFLAKFSIFVLGIVVGHAYLQHQGPAYWRPQRSLLTGGLLYGIGFLCQFYAAGWIVSDLLLSAGLALCCMTLMQTLAKVDWLAGGMSAIGVHTYSSFLLYGLVVDRMLQLIVQGEPSRYVVSLPVMIGGTLILAMIADYANPAIRRVVMGLVRDVDYVLSTSPNLHRRVLNLRVGDEVCYQGEAGWTVLKVEKLWDEQEFFLCHVSDGRRSLWVNEEELKPAGKRFVG